MRTAVVIVSRNRPDLVESLVEHLNQRVQIEHDIYVVESGTEQDKMSKHSSIWYADEDFKGKCFGHNVGYQYARLHKEYDYYLMIMNDVFVQSDHDYLAEMIEVMEQNPQVGVLSPTEIDSKYPGALAGSVGVRPVTSCDYLCLLVRGQVMHELGFLNKDFKYCWGAIHEYAYKLYSKEMCVAYYDNLSYLHLGGTTYGAAGTNTISRAEYQKNAKRFADEYFVRVYGEDWDERFWNTAISRFPEIELNTYQMHRRLWSSWSRT